MTTTPDNFDAVALVEKMENEASRGCGLHYELFESRLLDALSRKADTLAGEQLAAFTEALTARGWSIDADTLQAAAKEAAEVWAEIQNDML